MTTLNGTTTSVGPYEAGMRRILAVLEATRPGAADVEPVGDVETTLRTISGLAFFAEVIAATCHRDRELVIGAISRAIRNECQAVLDDAMNRRAQAL